METILKERSFPEREERLNTGIIGDGAPGSNLARAFEKAGISAVISNSRGPEAPAKLVEELGPTIRGGTTLEAAKAGGVFLPPRRGDFKKKVGGLPAGDGGSILDGANPREVIHPSHPEAE